MTGFNAHLNYGTFEVTTEGDCEGRSVINLGIFTGYIDEIAFALADKCYYSLHFRRIEVSQLVPNSKRDTVRITLDAVSNHINNSNNLDSECYFKSLFATRNVEITEINSYNSCTITNHVETLEEKRNKILSKLTKEEQHILGLDVH